MFFSFYSGSNVDSKSDGATRLPRAYILPAAKARLDSYIQHAPGEVSCLGEIELIEGCPVITYIMLFEQECSAASTDIEPEDLARFFVEAVNQGADPEKIRLWWHSHSNSSCFWSGTDNSTIADLCQSAGWVVSVVGNKKGHYRVRIDLTRPFEATLDWVEFGIAPYRDPDLDKEVKAEVEAKVKQKVFSATIWDGFSSGKSGDKEKVTKYPATYPYGYLDDDYELCELEGIGIDDDTGRLVLAGPATLAGASPAKGSKSKNKNKKAGKATGKAKRH